jgi:hypothetical protein
MFCPDANLGGNTKWFQVIKRFQGESHLSLLNKEIFDAEDENQERGRQAF